MTGSAIKYALRLLGYRGRSEQELRGRLAQKGFSDDIISETIRDLRQAGLVDDRAFAEQMLRYASGHKLLGTDGARRFLIGKGVPRDTVEEVVRFDEEAEIGNIRKLVAKKLKASGVRPDPVSAKRLWSFLVRRGYAPSSVRKALREYFPFEED